MNSDRSSYVPRPYTYFVRTEDAKFIKMGTSLKPLARIRRLIQEHGPLDVLAVAYGDGEYEKRLRYRFRDARAHGEWFHATLELYDFISTLQSYSLIRLRELGLNPREIGRNPRALGMNPRSRKKENR